jgi:predicted amidophosphoribosyltransferase
MRISKGSVRTMYKTYCEDCGFEWDYDSDYCPECGSGNTEEGHLIECECNKCIRTQPNENS